jgi:trans-2,3-dihydro-3-hydroxyanthranilate isomerase
MPQPFFFIDVFASEPLAGNPLSLVPDADGLELETMRRIAREFNQAETTFLLEPTAAGATWRLRSFTPAGIEVFGAGHNALGAWAWLADSGRLGAGEFFQEIGDEVLPVEVLRTDGPSRIVMRQTAPVFGATHDDPAALADALGLGVDDLGDLPTQVVSTGASHLLVPVRDRAAIARAQPEPRRLAAELAGVGGEGCYLFSRDTVADDAAAHTRFFNPTVGIVEDPATGTAAGPLACQLLANGLASGDVIVVEQGHTMDRPSRIEVIVRGDDVRIAGRGVIAAEGTLALP